MHGKFLIDFFGEFLAFFGGAIFGFDVEGNIGPVSGNIGPVSGNIGPVSGNIGPVS